MKALVFHGAGKIIHEDYPDPKVEEVGDIIVGVKGCSICNSLRAALVSLIPGMNLLN